MISPFRKSGGFRGWTERYEHPIAFVLGVAQLLFGGILAAAIAYAGLGLQSAANEISQLQAETLELQLAVEKASYEPEFAILEAEVSNGVSQSGLRLAKVAGKAEDLKMRAWDHVELRVEKYPFERSDLEACLDPAPAIALNVEGRYGPRGISSEGGYIVIGTGETHSFDVPFIVKSIDGELEPLGYKIRGYSSCVVVDVSYTDIVGDTQRRTMYVNAYNMKTVLQEWAHEPGCDYPVDATISLKDFERGNTYPFDELAKRCLSAYHTVHGLEE